MISRNVKYLITGFAGTAICYSAGAAQAQQLQQRLLFSRQRALTAATRSQTFKHQVGQADTPRLSGSKPYWRRQAQLAPGPQEVPATTPPGYIEGSESDTPSAPISGRNPLYVYVDTRFGFDKQSIVVANPVPTQVDLRRRIRSLAVTASYPLNYKTDVSLSVPFISQSTTARGGGQTIKQRGSGVGDISLFVQRRFPEVAQGTEISLAGGVVLPTGKDVFEIGPAELPTGNGFTEALVRFSIRKMRVPLQFYATVDYGKSFARTVNGQRFRLPDEYGGEVGFYYSIGPEFTAQTALSYRRLSSPFILDPGSNVAYLSQALTYNTGKQTNLRGTVDVGLTDDSTDAYLGLSLDSRF